MNNNARKKGFTLAEIIGVIVLIGVLIILIAPAVVKRLNLSKEKAEDAQNKILYMAASQEISENKNLYFPGKKYCITLQSLIDDGKLSSPVQKVDTGDTIDGTHSILVYLYSAGINDYELLSNEDCNREGDIPMIDFSVNPSLNTWSKSKSISIKYSSGLTNSLWRYKNGNWNDYSEIIEVNEEGLIEAKAMYKGSYTLSKILIDKIDNDDPEITIINSPISSNKNLIFKLKDKGIGVSRYAITTSSSRPGSSDSSWISLNNISEKTITKLVDDSGKYYIHVEDGLGNYAYKEFTTTYDYLVRYDANGGTVSPDSNRQTFGQKYKNLPTPTKSNGVFGGWYTSKTGGTKVTSDTVFNGTDDSTVLYAHWVQNSATTGSCNSLTYNGSAQTLASGGTNVDYVDNLATNAGSYTVTVKAKDDYAFSDGKTSTTLSCKISKITPTITITDQPSTFIAGNYRTFKKKASVKGKFTAASSNTDVVAISSNDGKEKDANTDSNTKIRGKGNGTSTITLTFTPSDTVNYNSTTKSYTQTINKAYYSIAETKNSNGDKYFATYNEACNNQTSDNYGFYVENSITETSPNVSCLHVSTSDTGLRIKSGVTFTLKGTMSSSKNIKFTGSGTLDVQGTISCGTECTASEGSLNVKLGSSGVMKSTGSSGYGLSLNGDTSLTMTGGTIQGSNTGIFIVTSGAKATISGGTVTGTNKYGIEARYGSLEIKGGTISGKEAGVLMYNGINVTMTGGTVKATGTGNNSFGYWISATGNGGTLKASSGSISGRKKGVLKQCASCSCSTKGASVSGGSNC